MDTDWRTRLSEMEGWYRDFATSPDEARASLAYEYEPYAADLASLRGRVLDLGGGFGFARAYSGPDVSYVVADPSTLWLEQCWGRLSTVGIRPAFVRAVGEMLPFSDASFDAVLCFWSLNHVSSVEACLAEMRRVLRRGGRAILVLEDMEPSWGDLARLAWQEAREKAGRAVPNRLDFEHPDLRDAARIARAKLAGRPWKLQPDHLRITERDLRRWLADDFSVVERRWRGKFLSYVIEAQPAQ